MSRFLLLILMFVALPVAAQCLQVNEQGMDPAAKKPGAAEIRWHAEIENRCEQSQDAILEVNFVDAEGERVYQVRDQDVIGRLATLRLEREIYVPAHYMESIKAIDIHLDERERPF